MKDRLLNAAFLVVAGCVLVMTTLSVRSHFGGVPLQSPDRRPPRLLDEDTWAKVAESGHRIGPSSAVVTVVVFSDFECPMCAEFATRTYPDFRDRYEGRTSLVYRHWPLTSHRFSYPAARAAECAAAQGRFEAFHDRLYAEQRLLGLKSFEEFAKDADMPDLGGFGGCLADEAPVRAIERDVEMVNALAGTGTPTVVINGWLLRGGVSPIVLDSIAQQFLMPDG